MAAQVLKHHRKRWQVASALKLTSMTKAAGCAAKLNPATLEAVLRKLPRQANPNVLVGFETNDDAGVYLVNHELALVQTVDFFTPIVDDPFLFGQIAAANALSDVYAMGGRPVSSLSLVGFPEHADPAILEQIIRGGLSKMNEAGCSVLGGHSIRTEDMLFGYAVTGTVHPKKIWRNVGARPGDVLIFTKPIGTGVITTALKKNQASEQSLAAAVGAMTTLNRAAAAGLAELADHSHNRLNDPCAGYTPSQMSRDLACWATHVKWRSATKSEESRPCHLKLTTLLLLIFQAPSKPHGMVIFPEGSE